MAAALELLGVQDGHDVGHLMLEPVARERRVAAAAAP
jgi:hypothetical protein